MSEQSPLPPEPMALAEFYAWADRQPRGRYELIDGRVHAMAPELVRHGRAKLAAVIALRNAIKAARLPCEAFTDGVAIEVKADTLYIPDASVNRGAPVPPDARALPQPVIVVEVSSPSTQRIDTTDKLQDYFRVPSIEHYVQINLGRRVLLHHRRQPDGSVLTAILGGGALLLDPPGLTLAVEEFFEA